MDIHQFGEWLSATPFSQAIQVTSWAIPGIQTVHIIALASLCGCAIALALNVLGKGFGAEPASRLVPRFAAAIGILLLVLLATGALLIIAEPGRTITNPAFYLKISLLAVAAALTWWLSRSARRGAGPSPARTVAAAATLLLWAGVMFAGRFIAYVESY